MWNKMIARTAEGNETFPWRAAFQNPSGECFVPFGLITLSFTILIAPHQFFYFRETFSGRRERTFFLTGFEKRRYLIFPALRAQKNPVPLRFEHEHAKTCACRSLCSFMFRSESAPTGKRFALSDRPDSHFVHNLFTHAFVLDPAYVGLSGIREYAMIK